VTTDPLLASLRRLHERAATAAAVFGDAVALVPDTTTAYDPAGAVSARVGADGLPTALRMEPDWAVRIRPDDLGAAVGAACRAAAADRMAEWSRRLDEVGWRPRTELRPQADGAVAPVPGRRPSGARSGAATGEAMRTALREAARLRPGDPGGVSARVGGGRVTLTLTAGGLGSCTVDPAWAAGHSATVLTNALNDALAEATRLLAAGRPTADRRGADHLDGLVADATSALRPSGDRPEQWGTEQWGAEQWGAEQWGKEEW
jgi:hypothetical protein